MQAHVVVGLSISDVVGVAVELAVQRRRPGKINDFFGEGKMGAEVRGLGLESSVIGVLL